MIVGCSIIKPNDSGVETSQPEVHVCINFYLVTKGRVQSSLIDTKLGLHKALQYIILNPKIIYHVYLMPLNMLNKMNNHHNLYV